MGSESCQAAQLLLPFNVALRIRKRIRLYCGVPVCKTQQAALDQHVFNVVSACGVIEGHVQSGSEGDQAQTKGQGEEGVCWCQRRKMCVMPDSSDETFPLNVPALPIDTEYFSTPSISAVLGSGVRHFGGKKRK